MTVVAVVLAALTGTGNADEPATITVTLASGLKLTAAIDARSNADALCLRFDAPGGILLRQVAWRDVAAAHGPNGDITSDELKKRWPDWASKAELPEFSDSASDAVAPEANGTNGAEQQPRIRALHSDAHLAHWGPNVEEDGIVLTVWPVDDWGQLVPVDATLEVELVADFRSYLRPAPLTIREPFDRVGSWTFRITPEDFAGGRPARVRLPFQAIDPQFTANIDSYGLITMRLAAAGHGVFASSVGDVRIRPTNNIRTRIENSTGSRFLPFEQTGRPTRNDVQWPR